MIFLGIFNNALNKKSSLSRTKKDSLIYSLSSYVKAFLSFLKSVVLAKMLGPALMGEVAAVSLILSYGVNLQMGTYSAMNREVPFLRGRGQPQLAEAYKNTAFVFTILLSLVAFVGLSVYAYFSHMTDFYKFGFYFLGLSLPLYFIYNFKISLLRFRFEFKKVAIYQIIEAILLSSISILMVNFVSNKAAILGTVISLLIVDVLLFIRRREWFKFHFDFKILIKLFKLGIPLIALGFFSEIFRTIDRVMIISYLDITSLGLYTFPIGLSTFYFLGGTAVTSVIYQKMLTDYGKTEDKQIIAKAFRKGVLIIALISPIIGYCIEGGVYFLIDNFLPQYVDSKPIISIIIPPSLFLAIAPIYTSTLVVVGKHMQVLFSQILLVITSIVLNYIFIKSLKLNIEGVSYATSICYFFYWFILSITTNIRRINTKKTNLQILTIIPIIFILVLSIKYFSVLVFTKSIIAGVNISGILYLLVASGMYVVVAIAIYYRIKKLKLL
jgi:O-antigen/teichoic acid export membrane protein